MFACVSADAGGVIPKWIQNIAAPTVAYQSSQDVRKAIMDMKINKTSELIKNGQQSDETSDRFEEIAAAMRLHIELHKKKVPSKVRH